MRHATRYPICPHPGQRPIRNTHASANIVAKQTPERCGTQFFQTQKQREVGYRTARPPTQQQARTMPVRVLWDGHLFCHTIIRSTNESIRVRPQSLIQEPVTWAVNQSVNQSVSQSMSQSINHPVNSSANRSANQSAQCIFEANEQ